MGGGGWCSKHREETKSMGVVITDESYERWKKCISFEF